MASSSKFIGKYEVLAELGRGGFAVVYKGRDVELDRIVALKVLRPALSDDPDFVARFKQEARAVAGLKHSHIVTVYDAAQIDGQLIIAMQYVEGRTLRDELAQGPLPFDRALTILEQIAGALDYAHQRSIVHRDVKPANILLEETSQGVHATLLDFGLAKAMEASTALTSQGTLLGSPEYMAPEQADPNRVHEIGPATDRYALGIVAYQLLTGRVPFPGNTPATLNAHLNLTPPDPHALRNEVSAQISAVLLKMLAKAPVDRYASAGEFVRALRSTAAQQAGVSQLVPRSLKPAPGPEASAAVRPVPRGALRWVWVLAGLLGVMGIVLIGVSLINQNAERERIAAQNRAITATAAWLASDGDGDSLTNDEEMNRYGTDPKTVDTDGDGLPDGLEVHGCSSPITPDTDGDGLRDDLDPAPCALPTPSAALTAGSLMTRTTDGVMMVYVPAGTFKMGSETGDDNERPVHDVTLDAFWIDRTEVTNAQYAQCVAAQQCATPADTNSFTRPYFGNPQFDDYPVIHVTWENAKQYCTWVGGQLPTEAQWEYAARGPEGHLYPWGIDNPSDALLNYRGAFGDTQPVGTYPDGASWVGALDLAGNVWEWVHDWYGPYSASAQTDPVGPPSGSYRVLRGGSWRNETPNIRSVFRHFDTPTASGADIGFRCVMRKAPGATAPAPVSAVTVAPTSTPEPTLDVGSTRTRTTDGMTMVYVPGGTFKMGSETGDDNERPVHDVTLDAFWIDRTEVTNAQYAQCVAADKCGAPSSTNSYTRDSYYENDQYDDYPVIYVNWINADKYCTWAGGQLPTEAQWEYAARGPNANTYPWGSTFDGTRLNFCDTNCSYDWADKTVDDGYADTAPVANYPAGVSWVGANDLAGNVWEWVQDWYSFYPDSSQANPTGPTSGNRRVLRGGSWYYYADGGRATYRVRNTPDHRNDSVGFRCVVAVGE